MSDTTKIAPQEKPPLDAKALVEYSKSLPEPPGFEFYDGCDEETSSKTFFRSPDRRWEVTMQVSIRRNPFGEEQE